MLNILKSNKWLLWTLIVLGELALLLVVFWGGMEIGFRKASFGAHWEENYSRFFGEPRPGFFGGMMGRDNLPHAFGNAGTVLQISGNTLVMKGNDNVEKTVVINSATTISKQGQTISASDLRAGDPIVVIGDPNSSGQIVARFIRVFPENSASPMPASSGSNLPPASNPSIQ